MYMKYQENYNKDKPVSYYCDFYYCLKEMSSISPTCTDDFRERTWRKYFNACM